MFFIKQRLSKCDCGVVKLETVLVLPIYLIMFAGLFWLGELVTDRSKLMVLDYGNAWSYGVRHGDGLSSGQLFNLIFNGQTELSLNGGETVASSADWWTEKRINGRLTVNQPSWINVIARIMNIYWKAPEKSGMADSEYQSMTMNSRDLKYRGEFAFTQTLYSRSDTYGKRRNLNSGGQLSATWRSVYQENFAAEGVGLRLALGSTVLNYVRTTGNRPKWGSKWVTRDWPTPRVANADAHAPGYKPGDCYMFYYTREP